MDQESAFRIVLNAGGDFPQAQRAGKDARDPGGSMA
jgi:hypothetical protein